MTRRGHVTGRMRTRGMRQRIVPDWVWVHGRDLFYRGARVGSILSDPDHVYHFIAAVGDRRSDPTSWGEAVRLVEFWSGRTRADGSAAA